MVPIHKRQTLNFQVLIWMICLGVGVGAYAAPEAKKDAATNDSSVQVAEIVKKASKKQEFSRELHQVLQLKEKAIVPLIDIFQDSNRLWQERWFSGIALSKFGQDNIQEVKTTHGTTDLRKVLINGSKDPLSIIRSVSVQGLSVFDDDESMNAIRDRMNDTSLMVRAAVVKAVGKRKDFHSADLLAKELFHQRNYYRGQALFGIRENIVIALGEIGSMKGIDPLIKVFQQEPKSSLEPLACESLEKIVLPPITLDEKYVAPKCPDYWLNWYYKENQKIKTDTTAKKPT